MKNKAFTLAEVLISLGIIGVISALTLPAINTSAARAKIGPEIATAISTLNEANAQFMNDYNADYLPVAAFKAGIAEADGTISVGKYLGELRSKGYLKGSAKTFPATSYTYSGDEGGLAGGSGVLLPNQTGIAALKDGSTLAKSKSAECNILFYTSSFNKTRKLMTGKEVFLLKMNASGEVYAPTSWSGTCGTDVTTGVDCAGRIAENGWKVDY